MHPSWANGAARGGLINLTIRAAAGNPVIDLVMPAPISGTPIRTLNLTGVRTDRPITWEAATAADSLRLSDLADDGNPASAAVILTAGNITVAGAMQSAVPVTIQDSAAVGFVADAQGLSLAAGQVLTLNAANQACSLRMVGSQINGLAANQSGGGSLTITADAVSIPLIANYAPTGTVSLVRLSDAFGEAYSPAVPGDWPVVPDTVQEALDELITLTAAGGFGPGHVFNVDKQGNDVGGDGTSAKPFLTINHALAVITANADNTAAYPYAIIVGPGLFTESIALIPFVWIVGTAAASYFVGSVGLGGNNDSVTNIVGAISLDASFSGAFQRAGFFNCNMASSSFSFVAGNNAQFIDLMGCNLGNLGSNFTGGNAGGLNVVDCSVFGINLESGNNTLRNIVQDGNMTLQDPIGGSVNIITGHSFWDPSGGGTVTIGADNGAITARISNSQILNLVVNGSTAVAEIDADSYPSTALTLQNGGTITLTTAAPAISYTAAVPANWAGTPPATVQEAIDRLAAVAVVPP